MLINIQNSFLALFSKVCNKVIMTKYIILNESLCDLVIWDIYISPCNIFYTFLNNSNQCHILAPLYTKRLEAITAPLISACSDGFGRCSIVHRNLWHAHSPTITIVVVVFRQCMSRTVRQVCRWNRPAMIAETKQWVPEITWRSFIPPYLRNYQATVLRVQA